ncbi:hypothetical protein [Microcoleus sp. FACHB-672]|uniref:hypothetical protein n=1 Tax=Microcoleus sp. FACHB-672 TaxID=2692825 RepID=UPI0016842200|nr:hypothetical protein [Microcoleus sp. FACHB-672]MBD2041330.1 hypothetical protein [Microcoleus sp. FACHB-672]
MTPQIAGAGSSISSEKRWGEAGSLLHIKRDTMTIGYGKPLLAKHELDRQGITLG